MSELPPESEEVTQETRRRSAADLYAESIRRTAEAIGDDSETAAEKAAAARQRIIDADEQG